MDDQKPNWLELHANLLELVLKKLGLLNILRFEAVCCSWYKAAKSYISSPIYSPLPQAPWLMLPIDHHQPNDTHFSCRFFDFQERKVYKLNNLFEGVAWCVGSSHGWLILLDKRAYLHVVNPFSRQKFTLPSLRGLPKTDRRNYIIRKSILLSDPSRSPNSSVVVILYGELPHKIAYCRINGDYKVWSNLNGYYNDILSSHNGQLYAFDEFFSVELWDFHKNHFSMGAKKIITPPVKPLYFVESKGDFLLLISYKEPPLLFISYKESREPLEYEIHKLSFGVREEWEKVQNLRGQALFVGHYDQSRLVSTWDFPEFQENSIYFTDKVHNLVTRSDFSFDDLYDKIKSVPSSLWIVPNL